MSFDLADYSYSRQRAAPKSSARCRHFTIKVGGRVVGLPVDCVKTIFNVEKLTPVPLAPKEVAGLANLRGRIVTALYLDRCLWLEGTARDASRLAVGIEHNGEDYALLIDETGDVVVNEEDDRITCPTHIDPRLLEMMSVCYRRDDGFLSILDIGALLRRVSKQAETTWRDVGARNSHKGGTP